MANRHWKYHFQGSKDVEGDSWNDGTGANKDIIRDEFERDYSEGNEEMTVVEHAVGGQQVPPVWIVRRLCSLAFLHGRTGDGALQIIQEEVR